MHKTKLLTAGFIPAEKQLIVLDREIFEELDHFKYLDSLVIMTWEREEKNKWLYQ